MLMIESHDVTAAGECSHGGRVGVVAHRDVVHHRGRRGLRFFGQQPYLHADADRRGVHHPRELPATDDADRERTSTHSRKRTGPSSEPGRAGHMVTSA